MDRKTQSAVQPETVFDRFDPIRIRYSPNELICQSRCYAAGIYLVTSGLILETYSELMTGDDFVAVGVLGPGDLIGTELLIADPEELHQTTCRALSPTSLSFLERSTFGEASETDELLRGFVTTYLAGRSLRLLQALWRAQRPADERLRRLLLELARFGNFASEAHVRLPEEFELRLLAGLACVSVRRARQICASIQGVSWTDDGLCLFLEDLAETLDPADL